MLLFDIIAFSLLALALGPLLILGVYIAADFLKIPFAGRVLTAMVAALGVQWFVGGLVNLVGGLALVGLGLWESLHFSTPIHCVVGGAVAVGGLWRAWRGGSILYGFTKPKEPTP